jgi:ATP-binding cassette subfamily B protein
VSDDPVESESSDREPSSGTTFDEIVLAPGDRRDLTRLPALIGQAFKVVWESSPRELLLAGTLQVVAALTLAAQLVVVPRVLNAAIKAHGQPDLGSVMPAVLLFGVLLLISAAATVAQRERQNVLSESVQYYTTGRLLDVSTTVDLIDYERPDFHDRLQRARVNAQIRPLQITNGVLGLLGAGVSVVTIGAALLWIEPLLALLIIVAAVPSVFLNRLSAKTMHRYAVRQTPNDRRRAYLYNVLSRKEEAQEVRAFGSGDFLRAEHDRLYSARIDDLRGVVRQRTVYGLLTATIAAVVTVAAVVMLVEFVRTGRITVGDAAAAIGGVLLLATRLRALSGSTGSLYEGALFLQDFTDFVAIRQREEAAEQSTMARTPVRADETAAFGRIRCEAVGFTYPSRDTPSLTSISFTIEQGEVLALVGENGSGKTTLTKLLAGLYQPTTGRILWDGADAATLPMAWVQGNVTLIFQDYGRYLLTARENIAISRLEQLGDLERVHHAAQLAGVDRFLEHLPRGYESLLGSSFMGGVDLSLGQWQRIALARAYFRDAALLILDEPTSSLDPRGEYEVFQQVRRLAQGRTVVLVSHRFSSVRAADRIIVLESGRIVEEGNHEALLAADGLYAELFRLQAEGYRGTSI